LALLEFEFVGSVSLKDPVCLCVR